MVRTVTLDILSTKVRTFVKGDTFGFATLGTLILVLISNELRILALTLIYASTGTITWASVLMRNLAPAPTFRMRMLALTWTSAKLMGILTLAHIFTLVSILVLVVTTLAFTN